LGVTTVAPQSLVIKTAAPGSACVVLPACVAGAELEFPPHAATAQANSSAANDRRHASSFREGNGSEGGRQVF
jgi:hypothetical protein